MSVLIKGMEMPALCQECDLYIDGACYAKGYRDYQSIMDMSKPDDCPLIEVPTPHGDLIDRDKLLNQVDDISLGYYEVLGVTEDDIDNAPTVIEAEEQHE